MPLLVRTPEQIFREFRKDIYIMRSETHDDRRRSGLSMILNWIQHELAGTHTELIAPSEYAGFIEGGIDGSTWVDFTPQGLARFCDVWEGEDGASLDPRFQCYVMPYEAWFQAHGRFEPTRDQPQAPGVAIWWHTPEGFFHHTLSEPERLSLESPLVHPANQRDIWAHLIQRWPDMARYSPSQLTYGGVDLVHSPGQEGAQWRAWFSPPIAFSTEERQTEVPTADQIRAWFCLPASSLVIESEF